MKKILCLVLALCLFCGTLISCDMGSGKSNKRYTVSFDTNGGSRLEDIELKAGEELRAPKDPTKEGYIFAGWYEDEDLMEEYVFDEMPAKDITLYAKWKRDTKRTECEYCGETKNCLRVEIDGENAYLCPDCKDLFDAMKDALEDLENNGGGSIDSVEIRDYCDECGVYSECDAFDYMGDILMLCSDCYAYYESLTDGDLTDDFTERCEFCGRAADCDYYVYGDETAFLCLDCKEIYDGVFGDHTDDGNMDVETDPVDPAPTPDPDAKYQVAFKYVDPDGQPMKNPDGETQRFVKVRNGKDARNPVLGDVQLFEDYVIIGWNTDLAEAMSGRVDENCVKKITADKTLYSVVREKYTFTVTFLTADGEIFQTLPMKEGSVIDDSIPRPVQMGTYFKTWALYTEDSASSRACIRDDCTFIATVGMTDGTIGKVAPGTITVDGIKEDAYMTSGAYLPVNTTLQADRSSTRPEATVDADTWLVWDGDYIYMLMEVSDKSLVSRADAYLKGGVDAWLNDTVEVWYNFEQDATLTRNETRVGLDAMGTAKYALPRSSYRGNMTGIGGGRSTHYEEIRYAVRNYLLGDTGSDLSRTGYVGDAIWDGTSGEPWHKASYIVEFAFPAWTEGAADITKGADPKTGLLPGRSEESNNIYDYAFTSGDKLVAGDFVRFNLQINDLMLAQNEMTGANGKYFWDCPPEHLAFSWPGAEDADHRTMLYATDGAGNIIGMANTSRIFSACGSTQRDLQYYVMFSLSNDAEAMTRVWSMGHKTVDGKVVPTFLDAGNREYIRP